MSGPALLVSVRDADEAAAAVAGGAAIVDVKDPEKGPLGRAAPESLAACAAAVAGTVPWTLAAGELVAATAADLSRFGRELASLTPLPKAVKFGLSGCVGEKWGEPLRRLADLLPPGIIVVPVAYADTAGAAAPPVTEVVDTAARAGLPLVLVDTFDKQQGGSLLELASLTAIQGWRARAQAAGLRILLAGRLSLDDVSVVAGCQPDAVAVRSAVCVGGRLGRIDPARVATAVASCRAAGHGGPASGRPPLQTMLQKGLD